MPIAPDDLEIGREYAFAYLTWQGKRRAEVGTYLGMQVDRDNKVIWLWFKTDAGDVPFDYSPDMKIFL